jgi:hypothetical protein
MGLKRCFALIAAKIRRFFLSVEAACAALGALTVRISEQAVFAGPAGNAEEPPGDSSGMFRYTPVYAILSSGGRNI